MTPGFGHAFTMAAGRVSPDRVNSRNGYRRREWDTRAGAVELAIPKLRAGSYYPEWLLERLRAALRAIDQHISAYITHARLTQAA
jgi:transposase-like protein